MRIIFVCHGNICRSPMAEMIMKQLAREKSLEDIIVSSAGVSSEEQGNDIYPPAKRVLRRHSIPFSSHYAHRITDSEFEDNDIIIALDRSNMAALERRFGKSGKFRMISSGGVDDPWYTDDFDTAYREIYSACSSLIEELAQK